MSNNDKVETYKLFRQLSVFTGAKSGSGRTRRVPTTSMTLGFFNKVFACFPVHLFFLTSWSNFHLMLFLLITFGFGNFVLFCFFLIISLFLIFLTLNIFTILWAETAGPLGYRGMKELLHKSSL